MTASTARRRGAAGKLVAVLALLALLSGCVIYEPYAAPPPPPRYHYWR